MFGLETAFPFSSFPSKNHNLHVGINAQNNVMQLLHFATFWFRLSGNILLVICFCSWVHVESPWLSGTNPVLREPPDWSRLARLCKSIRMIPDSVYSLLAL